MVNHIYRQHKRIDCQVPYVQFKKAVKQALEAYLEQHRCSTPMRRFLRREGDSLCKRLYTQLGPLIQHTFDQLSR